MNLIKTIDDYGITNDKRIAYIYRDSKLTYKELSEKSDTLAAHILKFNIEPRAPIVVFGHKQKEMIISFLACMKTGHPYIPVDTSTPLNRLNQIISNSETKLILNVEGDISLFDNLNIETIDNLKMNSIWNCKSKISLPNQNINASDVMYIIFTSGSTGEPKGSKIPFSAVESFVKWGHGLCDFFAEDQVILNQAPYSFDLSVMDLYVSLFTGSTIFSIDRKMQMNYPELLNALKTSNINIWVSTPSFAELCLKNKKFNSNLLPDIRRFIFCGEVLTNQCVSEIIERFPNVKIVNCYGPSECTFAVTAIEIDKEICQNANPLPVGYVKDDCKILICDPEGQLIEDGEIGEIIIAGESVGLGYINNKEATDKAFYTSVVGDNVTRHYKTGDKGFFKNGILYYSGRIDNQIKFNGYRIELEDIESNIRQCEYIQNCVVLPIMKNEKVKYLLAVITISIQIENIDEKLKKHLQKVLPDYMIPARFEIRELLPLTPNGKVDRRILMQDYI